MKLCERQDGRRWTALVIVLCLMAPLAGTMPARAQTPPRKGMSTRTKVVLLGGAALLYYLYRKHQAAKGTQAAAQAGAKTGQLYRSKNGGVYYRDAQGKPVWLTVPQQAVQVPASDVQRYAPNYRRYRGPAPAAPAGYRTQSFSQFDPSIAGSPGGPSGPGQ